MKLINRDTDYAIRAVCHIAGGECTVLTTVTLNEALKVPRPVLRKVLGKLRKAGILRSSKGKKGGFRLSRDARKISLLDIMKAVQGPFSLSGCLFLKNPCPRSRTCKLKTHIDGIEKHVRKRLRSINIASII